MGVLINYLIVHPVRMYVAVIRLFIIVCSVTPLIITAANGQGLLTTTNDGAYATTIEQVCPSAPLTSFTAAQTECTKKGIGWNIASLPSSSSFAEVRTKFGSKSTFVGARDATEGNWRWEAGRLAAIPFWLDNATEVGGRRLFFRFPSSPTSTLFNYTPWAYGFPSSATALHDCAVMSPDHDAGMLIDVPCTGVSIECVLCERSSCEITSDCFAPNTVSVTTSAFFVSGQTNCVCTCKSGYSGNKCQYPYIYDRGPYLTEYRHECSGATGNYTTAQARCTALGPEWTVASFPTDDSLETFRTLIDLPTKDAYVGTARVASYPYDGPWRWTGGRLKDVVWWKGIDNGTAEQHVFKYANGTEYALPFSLWPWAITEPQALAGEDCVVIGRITPPVQHFANVNCTTNRPCSACERSPCQLELDCVTNNARNVSGYYPLCTCVCKAGFSGDKCQTIDIVHDHGPYISEYIQSCPTTAILNSAYESTCGALGPYWFPASFFSGESMASVKSKLAVKGSWVGLSDAAVEGSWTWTHGRLQGMLYWEGGNTSFVYGNFTYPNYPEYAYPYNNVRLWAPMEPNSATGAENCAVLHNSLSMNAADVPCSTGTRACALCERSPCRFEADCHVPNTDNMTGAYFPDCKCHCKPGHFGSRCQYPFVYEHGPYESEYRQECSISLPNASAQARCAALGPEWSLASFPTDESLLAFRSVAPQLPLQTSYIGAGDGGGNGKWNWTHGRLLEHTFRSGSTAKSVPYALPNGSVVSFMFSCGWGTGELSGVVGTNKKCTVLGHTAVPAMSVEAIDCASGQVCSICERSRCRLGADCHEANTLRVTGGEHYPFCTCICRGGFTGKRCETSVTATTTSTGSLTTPITISTRPTETMSQVTQASRTMSGSCYPPPLRHQASARLRLPSLPRLMWSPAPSLPFERPLLLEPDDSSHVAREGAPLPLHQGESLRREEWESVAEGTTATCRVEVTDEVMERYAAAVGDKRFYVAEIVSFGCSVAVGVAEGLTPSTEAGCRGRAVCVLLLASIQCCCSVCSLVPAELCLQCLLSLCIVPLGIGTTVRSWGQQSEEGGTIDAVLVSLSLVINVLGFLLMLLSLARIEGLCDCKRKKRFAVEA